ncbi:MAG: transcription-repair coupling factor [Lachnospiraceae bacterium]|nr:transcription-repair coupling factor [Lachnospiraceae bacterium]
MKAYFEPLQDLNEYNHLIEYLEKELTPVAVTGCIDGQKEHLISAITGKDHNAIILVENEIKARAIWQDLRLYGEEVYIYPQKDVLFYSADVHGNSIVADRMQVIQKLIGGEKIKVVMTAQAAMDNLRHIDRIKENIIHISAMDTINVEEITKKLVSMGYERQSQVEAPSQFAIRGGIIDIYPLTETLPYRIELFGDEVDTIRAFDPHSQRTVIDGITEAVIYPACEYVFTKTESKEALERINKEKQKAVISFRKEMKNEEASRIEAVISEFRDNFENYMGEYAIESYIKYFDKNTVSIIDYFPKENTYVFVDEMARVSESIKSVEYQFSESMMTRLEKGYILPGQVNALIEPKQVLLKASNYKMIMLSTISARNDLIPYKKNFDFTVRSINNYNNNFEQLTKELLVWKKNNYKVIVVCTSSARAMRIAKDLQEYDLNAIYVDRDDKEILSRQILVTHGNLSKGFEYPLIRFAVISESDIFKSIRKKKRNKTQYQGTKIASFTDLIPGDYVVHENHGIGIYKGIEKVEAEGIIKDYLKLEYVGGVLYVPASGFDVLQKYASGKDAKPKINSLGSTEWKKTKTRVRSAVESIAKELVELYAARQAKNGFAFEEDSIWQREFEDMFPYEETIDQLAAIAATKNDMQSPRIMDRLICGDVGFGKTEIAIRAAFKAVQSGKQVAMLVPTTILAKQHYNTFYQRMKDYPVNVEMLSRFKTPKEQGEIIKNLSSGKTDIVIGTHKLLSDKVKYKDLGLLIIDEEQRFGVTHKEKIKHIKDSVDVLTLSATPIPRTLHMSLVGIRDMSVLEEPPIDRVPIQTYVMERDDQTIREAIIREYSRGGQVYFVSNRVTNIVDVTAALAKLVPEVEVEYAHGQMPQKKLEDIMFAFINGEIDVLVSTTIIETGLDISNVNTIIIDDADRFGLSQLYQLRGRVGRSNQAAYAFLMYKRDKLLNETASKRLQALREFTELGSGIKIAMKDLEIRGAGNLLGAKQHGHMEAVGYDLYCKLLNQAVLKLKGEEVEPDYETSVDLQVSAYIPASYIQSEYTKLEMYKRIALVQTQEDVLNVRDELIDRFSDIPDETDNLINVAYVKALAHKANIVNLTQKGGRIKMVMFEKAQVDVGRIPELLKKYNGRLKFAPRPIPAFEYNMWEKSEQNVKPDEATLFENLKEVLKSMVEEIIIK